MCRALSARLRRLLFRLHQFLFFRQSEKFSRGFERAHEPVRTARAVWRMSVCGASHRQPLMIHLARELRVNRNVSVTIIRFGSPHAHGLMPAVLTGDRVWMDWES